MEGGGVGGGGGAAGSGLILYHEVQEGKLCALHCLNSLLQGPYFSETDLAALAADLDNRERQVMMAPPDAAMASAVPGNFLLSESHNVSLGGDFSIQVLQKALDVWDLQVIPLDNPDATHAQSDPDRESAFICHLHDHWFCIRKVAGEWYNFDSLLPAPQHLSRFYLAAYLDSLKGSGWSIFLVRGNFAKECSLATFDGSNGYGQWVTPEDAMGIIKACNSSSTPQPINSNQWTSEEIISAFEDQDLKDAIAASLADFSPATASAEAHAMPSNESGITKSDDQKSQ